MTPLQIEILLHYWACADDYRDGDFSAPAVREAIDHFVALGLLCQGPREFAAIKTKYYGNMDALGIYAQALGGVPLPKRCVYWSMP